MIKNTIGRKLYSYLTFTQNLHASFGQTNCHSSENIVSFYSNLITHCLSLNSLVYAALIHTQFIKIGFHHHTFLRNRLLELYSRLGAVSDAFKAFHEIRNKNVITWNVLIMGLAKTGHPEIAHNLFAKMPDRDVVSWNTIISGYALNGYVVCALEVFSEMQEVGMTANGFTFSIVVSCASCVNHGKQVHARILRSGLSTSNVVVGNSLINMYGKLRLIDYALGVFHKMEKLDVVSWNSVIYVCEKSSRRERALDLFRSMRNAGLCPDDFTISTIITVCTNLQDLDKD